jgi:hypothetical protein
LKEGQIDLMKDNDMKKKVREDTPRTNTKKKRRIVLWTVLGLVLVCLALVGWHAYRILKQPASLFADAPVATAVPQATILAPAFPVHTTAPTPEPEGSTFAPSQAPEGTMALALMPLSRVTSTSTVGLPRLSSTSRPWTLVIFAIQFSPKKISLMRMIYLYAICAQMKTSGMRSPNMKYFFLYGFMVG